MPPRRKKKTLYVWADTPEIQAVGAGFAQEGFFKNGYEKARVFANVTTSNSLAARIKPDGTYLPARFAYATGIVEPDMGGIFALGTSAKELAEELNFKNPRALQTAFDNSLLDIDPSMPGTTRALLSGKPVFKFKQVATAGLAARAPRATAGPATRAPRATASSARAMVEYTTGLNNLSSMVAGLERDVERSTSAHYSPFGGVTNKELDAPLIRSLSKMWV